MNTIHYAIRDTKTRRIICREQIASYKCRDFWGSYYLDYFNCVRADASVLTFDSVHDALSFVKRRINNYLGVEIIRYDSCMNRFGTVVWRGEA